MTKLGKLRIFELVELDLLGRKAFQVRPEADGSRSGVTKALEHQFQYHRYYDHDGRHKDSIHVYGNSQPRPIARSHRANHHS